MLNEKPYVIVIDRGGNLFKIKEKALRELTDFGNYQALDFLDMFSDNEGE